MGILSWFERHFWISLFLVFLIMSLIFYLSSLSASSYPPGLGILTKVYHVSVYFLLGLLLSLSIIKGNSKNNNLIILSILVLIAYAISDELHQSLVPGRHTMISDVLIDSIGILCSSIIYTLTLMLRKNNKN